MLANNIEMEANTEREEIIKLDGKIDKLDGKVDYVVESLERVIAQFEKLETTRLQDFEKRLLIVEKWISEWKGVHRALLIISLLLGATSTILLILAKI